MALYNDSDLRNMRETYAKYGIYIDMDNHGLFCFLIDIFVPIFLFIIFNLGFKLSICYIPAWIAIGCWVEILYDYIHLIYIPRKKIKKHNEKMELKKKQEEKEAEKKRKETSKTSSYDEIVELIQKYASYTYPENIEPMVQDFLGKILLFVGDLQIHEIDPSLYSSFFKVHFCQVFDILTSPKSKKNIGNNANLVNSLLKNLTQYIERETHRICNEQNLDDISTLEALKNFYSVGNTFDNKEN